MKYDDGFAAYLNGSLVAARNVPTPLQWDSAATTTHRDTLATSFEDIDLSQHLGLLREGKNVLAIHGLNANLTSDDFLMSGELLGGRPVAIQVEAPGHIAKPTPDRPNGLVTYSGQVAPIEMSVERGFYDQPFAVEITTDTMGATLVYTTDGSAPSLDNGTRVLPADSDDTPRATLTISKTTTLRSAAFKDDYMPSSIDTQSYFFLADVISQDFAATVNAGFPASWRRVVPDYGVDPDVVGPNDKFDGEFARQFVDALRAAPSVSIVMDVNDLFGDRGIYLNSTRTGFDWERPTSVEFMFPDGSGDIQADAGLRIQGDNVRNFANSKKQSFRIEFRERYGPTKLRFPLFGPDATDSFDTIVLRGGYNDAWVHTPMTTQYIRDQWARTTLLEMGQPQAHGQFMHVYLNGFYWGLYNAVERPNASFSASYLGGDKDEWDTLNTGNVRDGTGEAWSSLQALARVVRADDQQQSNSAYLRLLGKNPDGTPNPAWEPLLDPDNYIDYLITNFYGGNVDWPGRNYYAGRLRGPDSSGFHFYAWDTEKILAHGEGAELGTNRVDVNEGAAAAYRYLRTNDEFRLLFADHVHRHFFHGGALYVDANNPAWDPAHPERNVPAARYHRLAAENELPLIGESARWGDTQSTATRTDGRIYTLREWRTMRDSLFENFFPRRSDIVLQQFVRAGLYPALAAPTFSQHGGAIPSGFELSIQAPGDVYYTLDGTDPRRSALEPGAAAADIATTATKYTGPLRLNDSTIVKARTLVDGQWSALNQATFTVGVSPLRIAEIMYHPRDPETGGAWEDDDFEFIELLNTSNSDTIDLEGITLTDGIEFVFPRMSMPPGGRVVVVRNTSAFQQRYGQGITIAGQYGGTADDFRLSNSGERLRLVDKLGQLIQEFSYVDTWGPATDGEGLSLTIVDAFASLEAWNMDSGWRSSSVLDGTPGRDDVVDFNADGRTDVEDVDLYCAGNRANDTRYDLTRDGLVNEDDLAFLIEDVMGTTVGDANLDGRFDSQDLTQVARAAEYEDAIPGNSTWAEGDWNCDGDTTTLDFVAAFLTGRFVAEPVPAQSFRMSARAVDAALTTADGGWFEPTPTDNPVQVPVPIQPRIERFELEPVRAGIFSEGPWRRRVAPDGFFGEPTEKPVVDFAGALFST
jgi:hypothetical protein